MANKNIFNTGVATKSRSTSYRNAAGGKAYKLDSANALCQYAVTSTFSDTYYSGAKEQLEEIKKLCDSVDPVLVAKAAVYSRENGKMKDVPAYLLAYLAAKRETALVKAIFSRVCDNPKMLLNFVQIVRSGVTGRKSFGSAVKNLIRNWLNARRGNQLFKASIGKSDPSLVDVIKMVHPVPKDKEHAALFAYLLGADISNEYPYTVTRGKREYLFEDLPPLVQEFEWFKYDQSNDLPDMDYRALTNCNLTPDHWRQIARNMPWNTLRLNLNTLKRNGVFDDPRTVDSIVRRLANETEVEKWNVFPYQLLTTYQNAQVPTRIKNALQQAMEYATKNVPVLGDRVAIAVDVSASMTSSITGNRGRGQTSVTRCVDVASLIASSLARVNKDAVIVPFGTTSRVMTTFNPWDSVMSNSKKLAQQSRYCGHGTNAGAAMKVINDQGKFDFIVFVSDCQSWVEGRSGWGWGNNYGRGTTLNGLLQHQKQRNRNVKLAEINVQAYGNTQADYKDKAVMNIGGFSDAVFDVMAEFVERNDNISFVDMVNQVEL